MLIYSSKLRFFAHFLLASLPLVTFFNSLFGTSKKWSLYFYLLEMSNIDNISKRKNIHTPLTEIETPRSR
jgi:hypothetical protein